MQGKYQNPWHKLRAQLLMVAGRLRLRVNELLEKHDLTQQQFNALRVVRGAEPERITVKEMRNRLLDRSSDTSRLSDRLIAKGLLQKCPGSDRRESLLELTPEGHALLRRIDAEMAEFDKLLQALTLEEALEANRLLDKLGNSL